MQVVLIGTIRMETPKGRGVERGREVLVLVGWRLEVRWDGMGWDGGERNISRQGVYNNCVSSQASRRRRITPFAFPIELALVAPIIRRAVATTNRRPRRRRCRRLLPKAPTGVWCSHLNRTRTSACSWGSTQRSSRFRSRARSERREVSPGLCATRTHYHLR